MDEEPDVVSVEGQLALAELYFLEGSDLDTAQNYAEQVIRDDDRSFVAKGRLISGKIHQKQGNMDESLKNYLKISYLFPEQKDIVIESLVSAAVLLKKQGKTEQMNRVVEKASQKADTAARREQLNQLKRETGLSGGTE